MIYKQERGVNLKKGKIIVIVGLLIIAVLMGANYLTDKSTPDSTAAPNAQATSASAQSIEKAAENGESMWLLFRSTTCAPCLEMQEVFDQLEPEYKDKVRFIAIDVNDQANIEILRAWQIQYIPTTFIVDSTGEITYQNVGVIPTEDLKKELDKVVK